MTIVEHFLDPALSSSQREVLARVEEFLSSPVNVFILKGYAGSGKTTLLKGLVKNLVTSKKRYALMAPTGRAAKILSDKTGNQATTIHKGIYTYHELDDKEEKETFRYYYGINTDADIANTIFIVDEASMISDAIAEDEFFRFGTGRLLSDLITFTRVQHKNAGTKIIFVGDPCQLPPVGDNASNALDAKYLKDNFGLDSEEAVLTEVLRHSAGSGVLDSAVLVRKAITSGHFNYFNLNGNGTDVIRSSAEHFIDSWQSAEGTKVIVTYQNKTAYDLNVQIRSGLHGSDELPPRQGDIVIIGANSYTLGVLNGEFAVINYADTVAESRTIAMKGLPPVTLTWRKVELVLPDLEGKERIVSGRLLENFLYGGNKLSPDEMRALYIDFKVRHKNLKPKTREFNEAIRQDEYFNCLKVKYGYAVTCHKAQGGEWDNVFIVWDYGQGFQNQGFYRWAYTAITRASSLLYNLTPPYFTPYSNMILVELPVQNVLVQLIGTTRPAEEVAFDDEMAGLLDQIGLKDAMIPLQDHCLRVHIAVEECGIDLTGWQRMNYEIRYAFRRDADTAVFKTFVNGKNELKNAFTTLPALSPNTNFNTEIAQILDNLPNIRIVRNENKQTDAQGVEASAEIDFDSTKPFTEALYRDMLSALTYIGIIIRNVEHLQYKERYTFIRGVETCVLDFNYNQEGFFGSVMPLASRSTSPALLSLIKNGIHSLKDNNYVSQRN
ncbi:AAA family ATPase [Chlorobium sp. BLA1]|uniref:ATP-dependent DNA helicase n=1 Tax=Candidatus Chlorobium masyuteum TaxID=2716876 RepID=UPI00141FCA29|nr:AAA family ATPase [Candidatus Chlorobium masyuteum]NHQ59051.1 AAA family ATPase [Candidatus Chlorobium masyuteum]